jgi:hypothetical protein
MKAKATADTLATRLMLYGKDIAHGSDCPAPHAGARGHLRRPLRMPV